MEESKEEKDRSRYENGSKIIVLSPPLSCLSIDMKMRE